METGIRRDRCCRGLLWHGLDIEFTLVTISARAHELLAVHVQLSGPQLQLIELLFRKKEAYI